MKNEVIEDELRKFKGQYEIKDDPLTDIMLLLLAVAFSDNPDQLKLDYIDQQSIGLVEP